MCVPSSNSHLKLSPEGSSQHRSRAFSILSKTPLRIVESAPWTSVRETCCGEVNVLKRGISGENSWGSAYLSLSTDRKDLLTSLKSCTGISYWALGGRGSKVNTHYDVMGVNYVNMGQGSTRKLGMFLYFSNMKTSITFSCVCHPPLHHNSLFHHLLAT